MVQKTRFGRVIVGLLLMSFSLALSAPAYAGRGGFGGGGMGMSGGSFGGGGMSGGGFHGGMGVGGSGFRGGRGAFASSGFHGSHVFHGHKFHGHRCCVNGFFFTGFAFGGGGFLAPYYYYPYPDDSYPQYPYMPYPYAPYVPDIDVSLPASSYRDLSASMPRESCFPSGCYHLQGDGVTVAYQWVWVPAPPPPPAVIPYPTGRYELRGPSRWEWVPNDASGSSSMLPASSKTIDMSPANLSTRGLYHWTDESGVTHWTQGLEGVPERYRPKASSGVSSGGSTL